MKHSRKIRFNYLQQPFSDKPTQKWLLISKIYNSQWACLPQKCIININFFFLNTPEPAKLLLSLTEGTVYDKSLNPLLWKSSWLNVQIIRVAILFWQELHQTVLFGASPKTAPPTPRCWGTLKQAWGWQGWREGPTCCPSHLGSVSWTRLTNNRPRWGSKERVPRQPHCDLCHPSCWGLLSQDRTQADAQKMQDLPGAWTAGLLLSQPLSSSWPQGLGRDSDWCLITECARGEQL